MFWIELQQCGSFPTTVEIGASVRGNRHVRKSCKEKWFYIWDRIEATYGSNWAFSQLWKTEQPVNCRQPRWWKTDKPCLTSCSAPPHHCCWVESAATELLLSRVACPRKLDNLVSASHLPIYPAAVLLIWPGLLFDKLFLRLPPKTLPPISPYYILSCPVDLTDSRVWSAPQHHSCCAAAVTSRMFPDRSEASTNHHVLRCNMDQDVMRIKM